MSPRLPTTTAFRTAVVASALATTATLTVLPAASAPVTPAPATTTAALAARTAPAAASRPAPATAALLPARTPAAPAPAAAAPAPAPAARAAGLGTSAMRNALGKLGTPYRWGATGPGAFDCSGLVNWAYRQEGVSLPRTSRALASAGTPVSRSDLRPGDLVLFYRPVSHVGIYVGDGRVVHASTSGKPVMVSDMGSMPFNSARRI